MEEKRKGLINMWKKINNMWQNSTPFREMIYLLNFTTSITYRKTSFFNTGYKNRKAKTKFSVLRETKYLQLTILYYNYLQHSYNIKEKLIHSGF